jgi:hypothetical protein
MSEDALAAAMARRRHGARVLDAAALVAPTSNHGLAALGMDAASVAFADTASPDDARWSELEALLAARGCLNATTRVPLLDPRAIRVCGPCDVAILDDILMLVPEPLRELMAIRRLLRVGGRILLRIPVMSASATAEPRDAEAAAMPCGDGENIHVGDAPPELSRRIDAYWRSRGVTLAQFERFPDGLAGHIGECGWGTWFWFFTPGGVERLLRTAGFWLDKAELDQGGRSMAFDGVAQ